MNTSLFLAGSFALILIGLIMMVFFQSTRITLVGGLCLVVGLFCLLGAAKAKTKAINHETYSKMVPALEKLLRGEDVPPEALHAEFYPSFVSGVAKQLSLSPDVVAKLRDPSRYTIRFNTNDISTATDG